MDADALRAVSALDDPTRRRVYDHVRAATAPVTRDDVAAAVGIGRTLAAYHLDRLAALGLLTVGSERRSGRTGPGAGRPAKIYSRAEREVAVTVPPRDYGLAARLLADAAAADDTGTTRSALGAAAARLGRELGEDAVPGALEEALWTRGYEPERCPDGVLRLRNCPFHAVAQRHPEVVCEMNLALLAGLLEGRRDPGVRAALDPQPGWCCVAIHGDR
jgi:predicted ArsR family transcriptional regulator